MSPTVADLPNRVMTPSFRAIDEAREAAVRHAMLSASITDGHCGTVEALPVDCVLPLLAAARRSSRP